MKPQVDRFFHFAIDSLLAGHAERLTIFNSDNDHPSIHHSVENLRSQVRGVRVHEFHDYGHFCIGDMHTDEFPELLHELIN